MKHKKRQFIDPSDRSHPMPDPCLIRIDGPHYKRAIPAGGIDPARAAAVEEILERIRRRHNDN